MTAPGWYPDPHDPALLQYFNGDRWTGDRRPAETAPAGVSEHTVPRSPGTQPLYHPDAHEPPTYEAPAPYPTAADRPPPVARRFDETVPAWSPTPRRAAKRRRRRPLIVGICAALVAGLLTGGWFALHKSSSAKFTFEGKKINHPEATLVQAEKSLDVIVATRHGVKNGDTRCYFATPADPPQGTKKTDVDSAVRCGPVLFVDGDPVRAYLSFPVATSDAGHGAVNVSAATQPISPNPAALPAGFTLRRPDGRSVSSAAALTVPTPPPAPPNALVAATLSGTSLPDAPHDALMVSLRGGVRLTKLGTITRYGTGDQARSAPPGQQLIALTYTPVPGQIANVSPNAGQLGISVNGGESRRIPPVKGDQVVVVAVPEHGHAAMTLNADGVRQSIALPSGTPAPGNLGVLRRSHIDAPLAVTKPITITFARPGTPPASLSGTVTVRHALIGYWTDDGKHHAKDGTRALLWMDLLFKVPDRHDRTGIDAPLLKITPTGSRPIRAKDLDPSSKVFAVFDVPANFTRGTVTISGSEPGNPTITVVRPVTFTVSIPN